MTAWMPGATLGIIGGGQLARMMIFEARRMGYRTCVLAEGPDTPAAAVSDSWVAGSPDDAEAAKELARVSDVITVDTEHVPASILSDLELTTPVRPSASVMQTIQDRRLQRQFLTEIQAPQPLCRPVTSLNELREAASAVGFPCVLKSARSGYDGKGQARIYDEQGIEAAWETIGRQPAVLEEFVTFDCEISALLARNPRGEIRFYPVALNAHRNHILHTTVAPAPISRLVEREALELAARIVNALDHVGMMAVEMFVVEGSSLLVNEIAPRPHNSGHYTFGACVTSQFEQHVRAVFDLPLADTTLPRPAAMVNLLGDLWQDGEPDWSVVFACPAASLHLYGKGDARPARKMGHVLVLDDDADRALQTSENLLEGLERGGSTGRDSRSKAQLNPERAGHQEHP